MCPQKSDSQIEMKSSFIITLQKGIHEVPSKINTQNNELNKECIQLEKVEKNLDITVWKNGLHHTVRSTPWQPF